jgi:hypothetical protein
LARFILNFSLSHFIVFRLRRSLSATTWLKIPRLPPPWTSETRICCRIQAAIAHHEVVNRIPAAARLADRLLGLATLCPASLGHRFASPQRSGSKRTGGLCARLAACLPSRSSPFISACRANKLGTLAAAVGVSILDPESRKSFWASRRRHRST